MSIHAWAMPNREACFDATLSCTRRDRIANTGDGHLKGGVLHPPLYVNPTTPHGQRYTIDIPPHTLTSVL
jgi:hypothetical protein